LPAPIPVGKYPRLFLQLQTSFCTAVGTQIYKYVIYISNKRCQKKNNPQNRESKDLNKHEPDLAKKKRSSLKVPILSINPFVAQLSSP